MGMCGNEIQRLKITEGKITEQVTEFKYLGNRVSDYKKYVKYTLQRHNRINGIIKEILVNKCLMKQNKIIHNITMIAALKYENETWVLNKIEKQCLVAAQMRFLRPLLGYTKLYHQRNVNIREQLEVQSIAEEIQTYQKNWKKHTERIKMRDDHN
jgi:hypothetical protein